MAESRGTMKHKLVLLGESGVGKSSLVQQLVGGSFEPRHLPTIGIDLSTKTLYTQPDPTAGEARAHRLQLFDTGGEQRFRSLIPGFLSTATCAMVVYDITSRASFEVLEREWIEPFETVHPEAGGRLLVVVGNKRDRGEERQVANEEGRQLASKHGALFFETTCSGPDGTLYVAALFEQVTLALQARGIDASPMRRRSAAFATDQPEPPTLAPPPPAPVSSAVATGAADKAPSAAGPATDFPQEAGACTEEQPGSLDEECAWELGVERGRRQELEAMVCELQLDVARQRVTIGAQQAEIDRLKAQLDSQGP